MVHILPEDSAGNCLPKLCDFSPVCLFTEVHVNKARMISLMCKYEVVCLNISTGDWILTSWSSRGKQTARLKLNHLKVHMNVNGKSPLLFKMIYGVKKTRVLLQLEERLKAKPVHPYSPYSHLFLYLLLVWAYDTFLFKIRTWTLQLLMNRLVAVSLKDFTELLWV